MILHNKQIKSDLSFLLTTVVILIIVGMIFIYSSSSVFALEKLGSAHYFLQKQIVGLIVGLVGAFIVCLIPIELLKKFTPLLFLSSLFLTTLTVITPFGQQIHGSARWLNLPFISFQPSELLKISLILYIAYFLTKKEKMHVSFLHGYVPLMIVLGITGIILLRQPDFGLTVTLITTAFVVLFIARIYLKYLGFTLLGLIPIMIGLILAKSYRLKRILTFLDPWSDAQGAGFQIIQSLIAIGSGGFFGVGIGQSKQKFFYLPMQHTDFIFSIIAEETGFLGASLVILLFLLFLYFGLRVAWQLTDRFCLYSVIGFVIVISLQALINICVTTGLAPTKGIGLPFISYGNTALVCQIITIGIIVNMVLENKKGSSI